jgi:transposase-like protein
VSRICAILDEQVEAFRCRPLEGDYPYLWLDGKAEKVRAGGRVVNKCVVIAYGVHETGRREILGIDVGEAETEAGDAPGCRGASRSVLSACAVRGVEAGGRAVARTCSASRRSRSGNLRLSERRDPLSGHAAVILSSFS